MFQEQLQRELAEMEYHQEYGASSSNVLAGGVLSGGGLGNSSRSAEVQARRQQLAKLVSEQSQDEEISNNFKVVVRVRPPLEREMDGPRPFVCVTKVDGPIRGEASFNAITITENPACLEAGGEVYDGLYNTHRFTFDRVYDQDSKQSEVYEHTAKPVVVSLLQGYNATIIAYGQTGTGKTYTMEGFSNDESRGIIPHATEDIFSYIQHCTSAKNKFLVRASYLQIYNENISDLLKPERKNLQIREDKKKGVFVEDLSEWVVRSSTEIYTLMERGASVRATGATKMNEISSRSHAIFIIIVEQSETMDPNEEDTGEETSEGGPSSGSGTSVVAKGDGTNSRQRFKIGKLNLVDLAGSERVRYTGATGVRLEESKKINQSLSALGNVIAALTDSRGRVHIPYRDAKLTRILADSLGGNCKTTMMAMISPALEAFHESLSTLKFANRAKNIKNEAKINEDLDQRALLRKYERELKKLRAELAAKSQEVVDKRRLLELEEDKRRAEEDKLAALTALEKASHEFMNEKEEKRQLEVRIASLEGQLLVGGVDNIEDTPQFRNALQQEYQRVHQVYEDRMAELERERQTIEEDKLQVDRYKQLLLKQRDIMIALTARLNERDETILALQEELEAHDRQQQMLQDALDAKTNTLIHLQRVALEHTQSSPVKNPQLEMALGLAEEEHRRWQEQGIEDDFSGAFRQPQRPPPRRATPLVFESDYTEGGGAAPSSSSRSEDLQRALEQKNLEMLQLAQELEEVKAEKVSLEYLLRERLEKMVQTEIEDRIQAYRQEVEEWRASGQRDTPPVPSLSGLENKSASSTLENEKLVEELRLEVHRLERELESRNSSSGSSLSETKVTQLQERVRSLTEQQNQFRDQVQERLEENQRHIAELEEENARLRGGGSTDMDKAKQVAAIYEERLANMIREKKMEEEFWRTERQNHLNELMALKQQCTINAKERQALRVILENKIKTMVDAITTGLSSSGGGDPQRLLREAAALQKLVNASVTAMKSSETESSGPPVPSTSSSGAANGR